MSKRARDSVSYPSSRDISPARSARKQPKLGEIAVDERPPVAGAGGSKPKRQGQSAPIPPMDGLDAHAARGMGSARRPGRQPSPTRGWKNSRDFDRDQQIQDDSNHNNERDHQHDESHRPQNPRPETPRRGPNSPAGKLNPSTRSQSYTTPLPLFAAEASRATSATTAPLTEQNLRSLLRSLRAEDSRPGTRAAAATATAVNKSEAEIGAGSRAKFAPAISTTGSGRAGPALASAPPQPAGTTNYSPSMPKSKSPSKSPKKQDREKKKSKYDSDTHPLNLPPEQLRAHLAQMARQEAESAGRMSLDRDTDTNPHDAPAPNSGAAGASQPATPSREAPGAFPEQSGDDAVANGVNGHPDERSPTPPPHRVPPAPKVDPEACKAAGNKFFKAKDYERAIQEYTKAVEAEPSNPTYLSNRAAAYISANKYNLALNDCLQASHIDPGNDKILHRLARVYTSLGRPQDALDTYAKIPNASATDTAAARKALQCIEMAQKQIDAEDGDGKMALWSIGEATKTLGAGTPTPRRWQILKAKANLKVGTANALGEVTGIAQSLMRDNPQDAVAIVLAGRALYLKDEKPRQGKSDYERAEDHFRQALALDPDNSEARNSLRTMKKLDRARTAANDMFKRGKYSDAVAAYTEAITIDPTNKVTNAKLLGNRAMARIKIKEYDEAVADCDQALKLDPSYMKARRTRAKATGESGDWEQAVKDLKALAEENASDAELAKELRNAELELKKSKRKDYYKILGIDKDAGDKDIERAYKKKAAVLHPDKTQGDKKKEEEFKDCLEAKETLLDPQKRQMYDSGADLMEPGMGFPGGGMGGFPGGFGGMGGGFPGGGFGGGGGVQIDPEMLFNMMNGGAGGGGGGFRFSTGGGRSPFG